MSNKTQLQTNNTKYASLIESLRGKALPGGGSSGDGANIETCTVTIIPSPDESMMDGLCIYSATCYENNVITTKSLCNMGGIYTPITLTNVIINSVIHCGSMQNMSCIVTNGEVLVSHGRYGHCVKPTGDATIDLGMGGV